MRIGKLDIRWADLVGILCRLIANTAWRRVAFFLLPYACLLVGMDVAAHYAIATGFRLPDQMLLSEDGGFGEWLEYSLTAATCVMLALLWRWRGSLAYLANAVLFAWMTIDNALQFHERSGAIIGPYLEGLPLPASAEHVGEALFVVGIGLLWLVGLAASLWRGQLAPALHSLVLAGCVAGTAVFGVVVDLFSNDIVGNPYYQELAIFIEDGGEFAMIIVSFLVALAIFDCERKADSA